MSLSSGHKRMVLSQRMSKLNSRTMSSMESTSSNCIAENVVCMAIKETCDGETALQDDQEDVEGVIMIKDVPLESVVISEPITTTTTTNETIDEESQQASNSKQISMSPEKASKDVNEDDTSVTDSPTSSQGSSNGGEGTSGGSPKSKTALLRNIFFSQIASPSKATTTTKD